MRYLRMAMAAAALTVALVIPSTASAQLNSIQFGTGQLGPEGASVILPMTIDCDEGWVGAMPAVVVRQAQGKRLVDGQTSTSQIVCTGSDLTVILTIQNSTGIRFKKGSAAVTGDLFLFNQGAQFRTDVGPQAIQIVR